MVGMLRLERCEICKGKGHIQGVFHLMECAGCNGGGFVRPDGSALDYPELVAQLRLRLTRAHRGIEQQRVVIERAGLGGSAAGDYQSMRNRRGVGGGNWTGD